MRYYKFIFFGLVALSSAKAYGQSDSTYNLQKCIDIAVKNNLDVKQSELKAQSARVDFNQAKENMLPTLNGLVNHGINNGRNINPFTNAYVNQSLTYGNYSLESNLTLFGGLQNVNAIKQTSLAYQAGKMDLQQAKDLVTINVITAYLLVLDNTELLAAVKNQADVWAKQVERLTILEKDGANKLPSDLYDMQGNLGDGKLNLVNANSALENAKLSLMQILNIPYSKNFVLQPINAQEVAGQTALSADQIYDTALRELALVKAAVLRRESAEKAVSVAKGALLPNISLYGGLYTNYSSAAQTSVFKDSSVVNTGGYINTPGGGKQSVLTTQANYANKDIGYYDQFKNNYSTQFGVSLRIPILNYFQNHNKVAKAKIDLLNYKYIEENTRVKLKQNVETAYLNMTSAYDKYAVLVDQVKSYAESFRTAEIRFNAGVLTAVDYVITKNNLDRTRINLINARYDCYIYNKILDYYQGKLTL